LPIGLAQLGILLRGIEKLPTTFSGTVRACPRCQVVRAVREETAACSTTFLATKTKMECVMNWDRVEGNWKQVTGKVKEQWGKLTDDDLTQINGNREQLEGKIQARYGYAKDQVRKDVDDWLNRM
jgi:uncharacterized protein YjbJ (UPF0337 family)